MINPKNKVIALTVLLFAALALSTCGTDSYFKQSVSFEDGKWDADERAEFVFDITQPDASYYLFFDIKSSASYKTSNLWLFVDVLSPSGTVQSDTLEYFLAEDDGKWVGEHSGEEVFTKMLYKPDVRFPEAGKYKIIAEQGMRENQTPLIQEFALRIEQQKE